MKPVSIFISYAHEDEAYRTELVSHLRPLERLGLIESWHDRMIQPGTRWADVIDQQLLRADVVLCLMSPSFFESDYCWSREMTTALARHNEGRTRVVPVLLRPVVWEQTPLAALQGLPPGMIAISSHRNRDAAWKSVAEGVLEAVHGVVGLRQRIAEAGQKPGALPTDPSVIPPVLDDLLKMFRLLDVEDSKDEGDATQWHDLALLRLRAPAVAKSVEAYRRTEAHFRRWQERSVKSLLEILNSPRAATQAKQVIVVAVVAEKDRRSLVVRLAEADALISFAEAQANLGHGLKDLLVPARFNLPRDLQEVNDLMAREMESYASAVELARVAMESFMTWFARLEDFIKKP